MFLCDRRICINILLHLQPPDSFIIDNTDRLHAADPAEPIHPQIAALLFHKIRRNIRPLTKQTLTDAHQCGCAVGPDYLHRTHSPRSNFDEPAEPVDTDCDTLAHRYRTVDFLSAVSSTWVDMNLFVANVLAGFSAYSVQWYVPDGHCNRRIHLLSITIGTPHFRIPSIRAVSLAPR